MQMANNATWTPRPLLNVARGGLASATAGGRIHVIGGFSSGFATTLASVEAHQPGNNTWELVAPMLTPRGNPAAAAAGNRIYGHSFALHRSIIVLHRWNGLPVTILAPIIVEHRTDTARPRPASLCRSPSGRTAGAGTGRAWDRSCSRQGDR
jgi:hypothetical protein